MSDENTSKPEAGEGAAAPEDKGWGAGREAELEVELAEQKDKLLRAHAEMENLRRRTAREIQDGRQYAITAFAREILAVADNLRRAIDAVPAEQRTAAEGALSSLIGGVEVTERELLRVLEKHGVKVIEAAGQKFDPNLHQAMLEVPNTEVPNGTVVQVLQTGYQIGERVLRPALVAVSKGGPRPAAAEPKPVAEPAAKDPAQEDASG
jgi:molecular chaperone GrpE